MNAPKGHSSSAVSRARHWVGVVLFNIVACVLLFLLADLVFRHILTEKEPALALQVTAPGTAADTVPLLTTAPWLGYRLNPEHPQVNALGMLGPPVASRASEKTFRVLILGDSIPFQSWSFAPLLEDILRSRGDYEVLTAAVPGYTSWQEAQWLAELLPQIRPDLVLWSYCLNDNHVILHSASGGTLIFGDDGQSPQWATSLMERSVLATYAVAAWRQAGRPNSSSTFPWDRRQDLLVAWKPESYALWERVFADVRELTERAGARLAVIQFPLMWQVEDRFLLPAHDYTLLPQTIMQESCRAAGIPLFDPRLDLKVLEDSGIRAFNDAVHPSPLGHFVLVRPLVTWLDSEGLLDGTRAP